MAYRWGSRANHSYLVGTYTDPGTAWGISEKHTNYRGGKYACTVEEIWINEGDGEDVDATHTIIHRTISAMDQFDVQTMPDGWTAKNIEEKRGGGKPEWTPDRGKPIEVDPAHKRDNFVGFSHHDMAKMFVAGLLNRTNFTVDELSRQLEGAQLKIDIIINDIISHNNGS